jgi:hypothetical protein
MSSFLSAARFSLVSCSAYSSTLKTDAALSFKISVDFFGPHGVRSQEMVHFLVASVRTSYRATAVYSEKNRKSKRARTHTHTYTHTHTHTHKQ